MATNNNNSSIDLLSLDFHTLKTSLKNYLRGQPQFRDYDFEGSNLNVLLDLLAYNTFKNSFYTNMAMSESHMDSAQLLSSVLSHAKDLNYTPRSVRSAQARVKVTFEATGQNQPYVIPKGAEFSTLIKNSAYTFSLPETLTVSSANTTFSFEADIYEGIFVKDSYVFQGSENQKFKLTNQNVDTRSLTVTVFEDNAEIGDVYKLRTTLLDLNKRSKVFFLQATEDGYYEILFGDDVIGRKPKLNSTILVNYRVSKGPEGNGARLFSVDFDPTGRGELTSTPEIDTIESARNGQNPEDIESIRYYAPRHFQVQERTVIDTDYEVSLKEEFPEINVVSVYGGEEANPPRMGKVFVSVDINNVDGLPESKKEEYYRFLKRRSPFSIDPVFIEPEYLYLSIDSLVRYDVNVTNKSPNRINTLVTDAITKYNGVELNDFKTTFRHSAFTRAIDYADPSIVSNITDVKMYKKIPVSRGVQRNYVIDFGTALKDNFPAQGRVHRIDLEHAVKSSSFNYASTTVHLEDDGAGVMRLVRQDGSNHSTIADVGTVDYETGIVNLVGLSIIDFEGASLKLYAIPKDEDITSRKNTILQIEPAGISVSVQEVRV